MMTRQNGSNGLRVKVTPKREVTIGEKLQVTITITKKITWIKILVNKYGENPSIIQPMKKIKEDESSEEYYTSVEFASCGIYDFFFLLEEGGEEKAIKLSRETKKAFITMPYEEAPYWRILVIQDFTVPKWTEDKIYYQIFVDRFYKSPSKPIKKLPGRNYRNWGEMPNWKRNEKGKFHNNDFFGGNLKGIEEKLPYLKSLGIGVIYLSPINQNPCRYDGYASINHMEIDPDLGDFNDLKSLHKKATTMKMHIILDIAVNHCSIENQIFQEALNNADSPYRKWFYFDENGNYKCWYNEFIDMPVFNQFEPEYQNYIYGENGVIAKFSPYVDGFRIDVGEELQSFVLEGIRNRANQKRPHLIITEAWWEQETDKFGKWFDGLTNYPFTNVILKYAAHGETAQLKNKIIEIEESYPEKAVKLNSLDTHDMVRALTILGGKYMRREEERIWEIDKDPSPWHRDTPEGRRFFTDEFREFEVENDLLGEAVYKEAKKLLKLATMIQYFLPGNPCLFYGTEVGSHGYKDPFNRKCFPWGSMDKELLSFFQTIGKARNYFKQKGCKMKYLYCEQDLFVFERYCDTRTKNAVVVATNSGNEAKEIELPQEYSMAENRMLVISEGASETFLPPKSGIVIVKM